MYATDAAVSKHLAKILKNQMNDAHKEYVYPTRYFLTGEFLSKDFQRPFGGYYR
jgi:hypothetical protein